MVLSTSTLRVEYAPACTAKGNIYLGAYKALDACFKAHGYRPRSGVTGAMNCRRITGGTGWSLHAFGPGDRFTFWTGVAVTTSLAVDVNWDKNPYGPTLITDMPRAMIDAIYRIRTNDSQQVWRWGGYYGGNKDAMHFEVVCSKRSLATGINPKTLPGYKPPTPAPTLEDDVQRVRIIWYAGEPTAAGDQPDTKAAYTVHEIQDATTKKWISVSATHIANTGHLNLLRYVGVTEVPKDTLGGESKPLPIKDWAAGLAFLNGPFKNA